DMPLNYTLSLHDALPICTLLPFRHPSDVRMLFPGHFRQSQRGLPVDEKRVGPLPRSRWSHSTRALNFRSPCEVPIAIERECFRPDRKSTRLNSSHVKISY